MDSTMTGMASHGITRCIAGKSSGEPADGTDASWDQNYFDRGLASPVISLELGMAAGGGPVRIHFGEPASTYDPKSHQWNFGTLIFGWSLSVRAGCGARIALMILVSWDS